MHNSKPYCLGFKSLTEEISIPSLPITGTIPTWLNGTLLRNGPAQYEIGTSNIPHWFDGFAMLHAFSFNNGQVSYINKFVESSAYKKSIKNNKISFRGFATDPCRSIFEKLFSFFLPAPDDNVNVNITNLQKQYLALTETPLAIQFDEKQLETLGFIDVSKPIAKGQVTTAHPHYDEQTNEYINYIISFAKDAAYTIYAIDTTKNKKRIIATPKTKEAAYMHSFAVTKNYVILVEFPLLVKGLQLLLSKKPFIQNYTWKPEKGTAFLIINRRTGEMKRHLTEAFFAFHHINAYEQSDTLVCDISSYTDPNIIDALYLKVLCGKKPTIFPLSQFRRYSVNVKNGDISYEQITQHDFELPRINYKHYAMKSYRYAYGLGTTSNQDWLNQIIKIDTSEKQSSVWQSDGCYPGEPIFVQTPGKDTEDEGILLSVILDTKHNQSFLLILDAQTMEEYGRAQVPLAIPFGLHGSYYS